MARKGNPIVFFFLLVVVIAASIINSIVSYVQENPWSTLIVFILFGGIITFSIVTNRRTKRKELEEEVKSNEHFVEEFLRIGEEYEKTGVPTIDSDIILKKTETFMSLFIMWFGKNTAERLLKSITKGLLVV